MAHLGVGFPLALRELEIERRDVGHLVPEPRSLVLALAALGVPARRLGVSRGSHEGVTTSRSASSCPLIPLGP
jgi:hypothetical protein